MGAPAAPAALDREQEFPETTGQMKVSGNRGQKTSAGYGGMTINYEYFANGWLKAVKKGANTVASYSYDTSGNRTRVDFGNGTYQVFDYDSDPRYRLASIDYAYGCDDDEDIEVRGTLDVTRDKTGNPLTWGNDDYKKGYAYDDNNRLKSADYPGHGTMNWGYDWVGNRLDTGFTYNAADQLTASPGKSYTYDGNGNMLTGTMSFSYTYTDLVATAGNTSMGWDSMGNRVSFTTSGSAAYQFVYDPTAGIPAVLEEVVSGTSTYYVRDPGGALIARLTGENLTPAYYHFDELGSTLFLTDPDGILTDKYTYDAWGNVMSHTGSTSQPYQYVGQRGYYTHYQESGFKLLQLGVRLYDPETGRFGQIDRLALQHVSNYLYGLGRPSRTTDPTGYTPTITSGASCRSPQMGINRIITWVNDAIKEYFDVGDTVIGATVTECKKDIMVQCWNGFCDRNDKVCGRVDSLQDIAKISFKAGCPPPGCTLLHEIVHVCGILGHVKHQWNIDGGVDPLIIPECGDLRTLPTGDKSKK